MHFELTVALKYLIPKRRQLSVSIISLISILVISLVVWLVVLFLSVTDGIEKKWVEQLVALNAPVRITPTAAYYRSYYYQIDQLSFHSNYTLKTIGEKLASSQSDPYDPTIDVELSYDFPTPDRNADGSLKDLVKEGWDAIMMLQKDHVEAIRPQEYEISFGNLQISLLREGNTPNDIKQTFLTQASYIASHDEHNKRLKHMLLPPRAEDYNNFLHSLSHTTQHNDAEHADLSNTVDDSDQLQKNLTRFFQQTEVKQLQTTDEGFTLSPAFFPETGILHGVGVLRHHEIRKVVIPKSAQEIENLSKRLQAFGLEVTPVEVIFDQNQMHLSSDQSTADGIQLVLNEKIPFEARLIPSSLENATSIFSLRFEITGSVQQIPITGITSYDKLEILQAHPILQPENKHPLWLLPNQEGKIVIPTDQPFGEGVLIAKHFQNNGVYLGDRGHLTYYTPTASAMQEQRIPIYIAGFYDPGMMPVGNKLLFVDPTVAALLRGNLSIADTTLGNGINIWLDEITQAQSVKQQLIHALESRDLDRYWSVQSYEDYDFARPVLQQLKSDKNLFTLIAIIILIVACSNIISMLILLVNDKKREIGILQSLGASPKRIASIFGICGFTLGLISCVIGIATAMVTLHYLQSLVNFLSFLQGHEAFQTAFYGNHLPNELSFISLLFVTFSTLIISLLAGIIPAIKAARIRPTEMLKLE